MSTPNSLTRVLLQVEPTDWHSVGSETLWATPLGHNQYRLENSPFYARGYSYLDVVLTDKGDEQAVPVVRQALRKSGHSTYAIWVQSGIESNGQFAEFWQPLEDIGCSFEGVRGQLLSVDVPATTDVSTAFRLMQAAEDRGVWSFQEQDYGHPNAA